MRKIFLMCLMAFTATFNLQAGVYLFDAQTNESLRSDMKTFVKSYMNSMKGHRIYTDLEFFLSEVSAVEDAYPYDWIDRTFKFVEAQLAIYPPTGDHVNVSTDIKSASIRRFLLKLKDYPVHTNNFADVSPYPASGQAEAFDLAIGSTRERSFGRLLNWLDTPAPAAGEIQIFKTYNMGMVVRTASHCLAFDLYWTSSNANADKLCNNAEAVFVTHAHGDHFSTYVLNKMSSLNGKAIFMPSSVPSVAGFVNSGKATVYSWNASQTSAVNFNGIKVRAAMGCQGSSDVPCLCYCVEVDGWCLWICGDNTQASAYSELKNFTAPDFSTVSLASDFSSLCDSAKKASNASSKDLFYIPAHENEVGHPVSGRVSWKFFFESSDFGIANSYIRNLMGGPILCLDWGEYVTFSR